MRLSLIAFAATWLFQAVTSADVTVIRVPEPLPRDGDPSFIYYLNAREFYFNTEGQGVKYLQLMSASGEFSGNAELPDGHVNINTPQRIDIIFGIGEFPVLNGFFSFGELVDGFLMPSDLASDLTLTYSTDLDRPHREADVLFFSHSERPTLAGIPAPDENSGTISLQLALESSSGRLDDAIMLIDDDDEVFADFSHLGEITATVLNDDYELFGAEIDGEYVDLLVDTNAAKDIEPGTKVTAELLVEATFPSVFVEDGENSYVRPFQLDGGNDSLRYTLSAIIVPESPSLILAAFVAFAALAAAERGIRPKIVNTSVYLRR